MTDFFWVYQLGKRIGAHAVNTFNRWNTITPIWTWEVLFVGVILSLF